MTNIVISFLIGTGVYLLGLGVFVLIKSIRNKRRFKKELQEHENESEDSTSSTQE